MVPWLPLLIPLLVRLVPVVVVPVVVVLLPLQQPQPKQSHVCPTWFVRWCAASVVCGCLILNHIASVWFAPRVVPVVTGVVSGSGSWSSSSFLFAYYPTHFVAAIICFFAIHDSHDSHVLIAPCFVGRVEHWCSPSFAIPMTLFVVRLFLCLL